MTNHFPSMNFESISCQGAESVGVTNASMGPYCFDLPYSDGSLYQPYFQERCVCLFVCLLDNVLVTVYSNIFTQLSHTCCCLYLALSVAPTAPLLDALDGQTQLQLSTNHVAMRCG